MDHFALAVPRTMGQFKKESVSQHRVSMRMSAITIIALFLAAMPGLAQPTTTNSANGGKSSKPASPPPSARAAVLTSAQATALAIQLANDKADALFHQRPFQDGRPAQLLTGKWVWTDGCGVALLDYEASVKLAADGSTNSVKVQLLDGLYRPMYFRSRSPMIIPRQSIP
jgi:hypothetical protein